MTGSAEPRATLSHLHRADGSATFSQHGYTIIGAVNGPMEVSRRDELPESAAVEVMVRPAAGVGGTRERHIESILQSTLRQIILVHNFPRTLVQITLQITSNPGNDSAGSKLGQASSNLPVLPSLLQTAVLALLSASIPLSTTLTSVLLAVSSDGASNTILTNPTESQSQRSNSVHVLAFTSHGKLIVAESEGSFTLEEWNDVHDLGKRLCYAAAEEEDNSMEDEHLDEKDGGMTMFVKATLKDKIEKDLHWKA